MENLNVGNVSESIWCDRSGAGRNRLDLFRWEYAPTSPGPLLWRRTGHRYLIFWQEIKVVGFSSKSSKRRR